MLKHLPSSCAWLGAIFAAFGTAFFVIGAHTFYRNCQFAGDVLHVSGIVTGHYTTTSHGRHGSSTTYHLDYAFQDNEWNEYRSTASVQSQTYYALQKHSRVPVKYLPHHPTISRVDLPAEDRNQELAAWMFMGMGGLFGG